MMEETCVFVNQVLVVDPNDTMEGAFMLIHFDVAMNAPQYNIASFEERYALEEDYVEVKESDVYYPKIHLAYLEKLRSLTSDIPVTLMTVQPQLMMKECVEGYERSFSKNYQKPIVVKYKAKSTSSGLSNFSIYCSSNPSYHVWGPTGRCENPVPFVKFNEKNHRRCAAKCKSSIGSLGPYPLKRTKKCNNIVGECTRY